jgi:hypothetical protein
MTIAVMPAIAESVFLLKRRSEWIPGSALGSPDDDTFPSFGDFG